jgi:hypothetical protein
MNRVLLIIFLGFLVATPFLAYAEQFVLYWPSEVLQTGNDLEIYELSISMTCGQFRAVRNIPEDWNLEIIRPISERTELKASAGHMGSHLENMRPLNGVIAISVDEVGCFDIKAQLVSFSALRSYGKAQLQLKKESNKSLHSDGPKAGRQ